VFDVRVHPHHGNMINVDQKNDDLRVRCELPITMHKELVGCDVLDLRVHLHHENMIHLVGKNKQPTQGFLIMLMLGGLQVHIMCCCRHVQIQFWLIEETNRASELLPVGQVLQSHAHTHAHAPAHAHATSTLAPNGSTSTLAPNGSSSTLAQTHTRTHTCTRTRTHTCNEYIGPQRLNEYIGPQWLFESTLHHAHHLFFYVATRCAVYLCTTLLFQSNVNEISGSFC
jgi:hypothetical protein